MDDLPPEVPETAEDLEIAIKLLGNVGQHGKLKPSLQAKIMGILGAYPTSKQAVLWKAALKGLREDMRELDRAGRKRRIVG